MWEEIGEIGGFIQKGISGKLRRLFERGMRNKIRGG